MPKLLIISGSLPPIKCGVGYYVARLSRELAAAGVNFQIVSTEGVAKNLPASTLTTNSWKLIRLPAMFSLIKKTGAEIVHIQYPTVGYRRQLGINLLPYILRIFRPSLKVLVTLHEYSESRFIGRCRNFITSLPAHRIIVSNQADLEALPKRLLRKSLIIPIGSTVDKAPRNRSFFKETMLSHKLDPARPTLFYFGFAFPSKNLAAMLAAMDEPAMRGWQLLMLTELNAADPYQKSLLDRVAAINLGSIRVSATGFLDEAEISVILQEGKYFIFPQFAPLSAKSSTAITAVQHDLILIAHRPAKPATAFPYAHSRNCFLLREVTGSSIAGAIEKLEASPGERMKIHNGMEALKSYFSWDTIARKHINLYEEVDGTHRS